MKKIFFIGIISLILFAAQAASAQTPIRIKFAKGKSSATIRGNTGSNGVYYVIGAKSGQLITIRLTPAKGVGVKVESDGPDGQEVLLREEKGGTYQIGLDRGGDFTIFLGSTNNRPKAFTLTVSIRKMADI